ncbi:MAG: DNA mismatch repair protein MutS [Dehalococcoidia bacterium]|nr:DNA mismatch repair protein MutS [Dehalococcoidia bacterium]MDW8120384.1 DNA mismatch repair protein MutS [Chloroflexota bacterium]
MGTPEKAVPIWRQYQRIKRAYPDCIVLFRLGDFYETFGEDAYTTSRELEITLTAREMGKGHRVPMAGIPYHALEGYLARLIKKGFKVAICEQLGDPATAKGLVEREVVRVVTPGTVLEPALLDQKANNYLCALVLEGDAAGLAYADISTGEFAVTQCPWPQALLELERLAPAELLLPEGAPPPPGGNATTPLPAPAFDLEEATERLKAHLGVHTLEAFGCAHLPLAIRAAGAVLFHLARAQKGFLGLITSLRTYTTERYMPLDARTRRHLEVFQGGRTGTGPSLLGVLDYTRTPMGGRLLRKWLAQPLLDIQELEERLDRVAWLVQHPLEREGLRGVLKEVADIERLLNRVRAGMATPREVVALRRGLEALPRLVEVLQKAPPFASLCARIHLCPEAVDLIARAVEEEASTPVGEGGVIKEGFSKDLDEVRYAARNAREVLAGLEQKERERTGIASLKVGFNKVFGYYIEVSKPNLAKVPPHYIRRQTLTDAERFITPELKEYEALILNAQERIAELESFLFRQVCRQVGEMAPRILETAQAVAEVDVLASFAEAAQRHGYVRPILDEAPVIHIKGGRHPVVEQVLPPGAFVPNDTLLDTRQNQILLLTGPNMSGKSTYIRQVALMVLMAQVGSFVPAQEARIGLVDRLFTRIGLQDDLAEGQSTFMVEMVETAHILHHATARSLVLLDEVGRGTSTYDGLAIAQAVLEYLHNHPRLGCRTLFATHYHELTALEGVLPRLRNYTVQVQEEGGKVVFLHRIVPGKADRSYGVHVAQLAGMPRGVVQRAWEVLRSLEEKRSALATPTLERPARRDGTAQQLSLFAGVGDSLLQEVLALDLHNITPLEALTFLYHLQSKARALFPAAPPAGRPPPLGTPGRKGWERG